MHEQVGPASTHCRAPKSPAPRLRRAACQPASSRPAAACLRCQLRMLRRAARLTQVKLATLIRFTRTTVAMAENRPLRPAGQGRDRPRRPTARILAGLRRRAQRKRAREAGALGLHRGLRSARRPGGSQGGSVVPGVRKRGHGRDRAHPRHGELSLRAARALSSPASRRGRQLTSRPDPWLTQVLPLRGGPCSQPRDTSAAQRARVPCPAPGRGRGRTLSGPAGRKEQHTE